MEIEGALGKGQVGTCQIGRASDELGNDIEDFVENVLGQLARGNGRIGRGVNRQMFLPPLRKVSLLAADEVVVLGLVLLGVLGKELVPLLLLGGTFSSGLVAEVVNLLANNKALLGVEAEGLLQLLDIVSL